MTVFAGSDWRGKYVDGDEEEDDREVEPRREVGETRWWGVVVRARRGICWDGRRSFELVRVCGRRRRWDAVRKVETSIFVTAREF